MNADLAVTVKFPGARRYSRQARGGSLETKNFWIFWEGGGLDGSWQEMFSVGSRRLEGERVGFGDRGYSWVRWVGACKVCK